MGMHSAVLTIGESNAKGMDGFHLLSTMMSNLYQAAWQTVDLLVSSVTYVTQSLSPIRRQAVTKFNAKLSITAWGTYIYEILF